MLTVCLSLPVQSLIKKTVPILSGTHMQTPKNEAPEITYKRFLKQRSENKLNNPSHIREPVNKIEVLSRACQTNRRRYNLNPKAMLANQKPVNMSMLQSF